MTHLELDIANGTAGAAAAAGLRRAVFVREMGAAEATLRDRHDCAAEHLLLTDPAWPDRGIVAALRLSCGVRYTEAEFDLSAPQATGRRMAEIGRMCLHRDYRGGVAGLTLLRAALARTEARGVELVVGTASLFGADPDRHRPTLRALRRAALAPPDLRPRARGPGAIEVDDLGAPADMRGVPPLIKSYLRAGAWVGDGAFLDRAFNCVDVCVLLDLARLRLPAGLRDGADGGRSG